MARTLAIVSQKGGVGKTTTAVNLAAALAREGQEVLLVEVDPQGSVLPSLGIDPATVRHALLDLLADEGLDPREAVLNTEFERVSVLPALGPGREDELQFDRIAAAHPLLLAETLDRLRPQFDTIVLDAPPTLGPIARMALAAADRFLVPVQAEEYAFRSLDRLFRVVEEVRHSLNPELHCEGLLLTMVDLRTRMSMRVINQLHENYGDQVLVAMVPRTVSLQDMPVRGKPTVVHAPTSRGGKAYAEAALELMVGWQVPDNAGEEDYGLDEESAPALLARAGEGAVLDTLPALAAEEGPMISRFPSTRSAEPEPMGDSGRHLTRLESWLSEWRDDEDPIH